MAVITLGMSRQFQSNSPREYLMESNSTNLIRSAHWHMWSHILHRIYYSHISHLIYQAHIYIRSHIWHMYIPSHLIYRIYGIYEISSDGGGELEAALRISKPSLRGGNTFVRTNITLQRWTNADDSEGFNRIPSFHVPLPFDRVIPTSILRRSWSYGTENDSQRVDM